MPGAQLRFGQGCRASRRRPLARPRWPADARRHAGLHRARSLVPPPRASRLDDVESHLILPVQGVFRASRHPVRCASAARWPRKESAATRRWVVTLLSDSPHQKGDHEDQVLFQSSVPQQPRPKALGSSMSSLPLGGACVHIFGHFISQVAAASCHSVVESARSRRASPRIKEQFSRSAYVRHARSRKPEAQQAAACLLRSVDRYTTSHIAAVGLNLAGMPMRASAPLAAWHKVK
jgi:hypothetical protein